MAELEKMVQGKARPPFSDEALANIRAWQAADCVHPLTCPNTDEGHGTDLLTPLRLGLVCLTCGHTQLWVPLMVADGSGLAAQQKLHDELKMAARSAETDGDPDSDEIDVCLQELQQVIDGRGGNVPRWISNLAITAMNIIEVMRKEAERRTVSVQMAMTDDGMKVAAAMLAGYNAVEIERLRARVDELLRANNALVEDRRVRDVALTAAAETFDFYAGHHREKLNANLDPRLTAGLKDKVDRNVDRAAMCRAARDRRTVPANG